MIDREGKREKLLEGKNRERKLRERYDLKNTELVQSPRGDRSPSAKSERVHSARNERIPSPRGNVVCSPRSPRREVDHSPRGEIAGETAFNFEDKIDIVDNGANEFNSVFDPNMKGDDDDVNEIPTEKALFDMQFCDVLNTILAEVKK